MLKKTHALFFLLSSAVYASNGQDTKNKLVNRFGTVSLEPLSTQLTSADIATQKNSTKTLRNKRGRT